MCFKLRGGRGQWPRPSFHTFLIGRGSLLLLLILAACNESLPPEQAPSEASIAYSGNFRGFQRPCGCNDEQLGGLPRLGSVLDAARAELSRAKPPQTDLPQLYPPDALALPHPLWLIECGNFSSAANRFPGLRSLTHLQVLASLGFKAAIPGSAELELTEEHALASLGESPVPITSCNLKPRSPDLSVARYVELAPGWYVVGVTADRRTPEARAEGWAEVGDPVECAREVIEQLPERAQVIIAAAEMSPALAKGLASLPITLVIGYDSASDPDWPDNLAPAVAPPSRRGTSRNLVALRQQEGRGVVEPWEVALGEQWPDKGSVLELLGEGQNRAGKRIETATAGWRDIDWGSPGGMKQAKNAPSSAKRNKEYLPAYAGSESCQACHAEAYAAWAGSAHSHAYEVLVERQEAMTLDCLECHSVGLAEPGGFDPTRPEQSLAAVGCESCHGPGQQHILLFAGKKKAGELQDDLKIMRGDLASCQSCHDDYNSPAFEQESYWQRIDH
ncbi:hypothetical protein IIA79_02360 [bacterium]|nr:hypothetical protein [bacterium]